MSDVRVASPVPCARYPPRPPLIGRVAARELYYTTSGVSTIRFSEPFVALKALWSHDLFCSGSLQFITLLPGVAIACVVAFLAAFVALNTGLVFSPFVRL